MARLNPRRRLLAKQASVLNKAHSQRMAEFDDSTLMQQGNVKSHMTKFQNKVGAGRPPRDNWEGMGSKAYARPKRFGLK
jgi:hypothetical protein